MTKSRSEFNHAPQRRKRPRVHQTDTGHAPRLGGDAGFSLKYQHHAAGTRFV
jgi:hypothetical protein